MRVPDTDKCRPTSDKVREAVFATLKPFLKPETLFLDLFAGSGAMGLEAASRGVGAVTLVDTVTYSIEENVERLGLKAICHIWRGDALRYLAQNRKQAFDVIVMDPPYAKTVLLETCLKEVVRFSLLREGGLIVVEHAAASKLTLPQELACIRSKAYGDTRVGYVGWLAYNPFEIRRFTAEQFT